jgi:hypothetical protein
MREDVYGANGVQDVRSKAIMDGVFELERLIKDATS